MPRHATSTSGQGRPKGAVNKTTKEIKALAREFGPPAISKLAQLSGLLVGTPAAESEGAQIAAIKELLDRGYGKATQEITGANGDSLITIITGVRRELVDATPTGFFTGVPRQLDGD